MTSDGSSYSGVELVLLTRHGKERVISPILESVLGCRVRHESGYDTDRLGTFTGEISRSGTQLEAARKKARIGMELTGLPRGLASEGAFGPDPFTGLFSWNVELIVFIDAERDLELVGINQGKACFEHLLCGDWAAVESFARGVSFPEQQLVMRPGGQDDPRLCKGIASWSALKAAYTFARNQFADGQVFIETDCRAHANPTRMTNIRLAAQNLAHKIGSHCPACDTIGYWPAERVPGLACEACGLPTRQLCAEIWSCLKCGYRERRPVTGTISADPAHCEYCNP